MMNRLNRNDLVVFVLVLTTTAVLTACSGAQPAAPGQDPTGGTPAVRTGGRSGSNPGGTSGAGTGGAGGMSTAPAAGGGGGTATAPGGGSGTAPGGGSGGSINTLPDAETPNP